MAENWFNWQETGLNDGTLVYFLGKLVSWNWLLMNYFPMPDSDIMWAKYICWLYTTAMHYRMLKKIISTFLVPLFIGNININSHYISVLAGQTCPARKAINIYLMCFSPLLSRYITLRDNITPVLALYSYIKTTFSPNTNLYAP